MKYRLHLLLFSIVITLALAEIILRMAGTRPGRVNGFDGFEKVDNLTVYKNFITDEAGIYKFGPWVTDTLLKYFDCGSRQVVNPQVKDSLQESESIYYVYETFCKQTGKPAFSFYWTISEFLNNEADSNFLAGAFTKIAENKIPADKGWSDAFLAYYNRPFNREGFRGVEFKNHTTNRLKVLVIGDSYVYGLSAHPIQNSFTDILLSRGYLVYAAGIPGTDPAQYAAIAQKYIPIIKPDVVVSCFFTGNDFMKYPREPAADRPIEYMTNAGLFASEPAGNHLSANEAYRFYTTLSTFPDTCNRFFDKACSYTAIGTVLWNALLNKGRLKHVSQNFYAQQATIPTDTINAVTKVYTDRIAAICAKDSVPLIQAVIPALWIKQVDTASLKYLFGSNYFLPYNLNVNANDQEKDWHFNNERSLKYANFLDTLLQPYVAVKAQSLTKHP